VWVDDAVYFRNVMKSKRRLIFICNGSDCKKCGAKEIGKDLREESKSDHLKGTCKIIKTKCMDMCKSAPVAIVNEHFLKKTNAQKIILELKKS
jgi:NADH:ubiquinone oxidoreductase subunit E